ncbi:MAG: F0F1 ATP synthase subunit delta [Parvibaculaceae bacterium]|nr:F0F1 ATP synthase subunit delta [Parvibaculaceae bacterium]
MSADQTLATGMAGRYATALIELAEAQGVLAQVETDLLELGTLLTTSGELNAFVSSPLYGADEQSAALSALLTKAGVQTLTSNFVGVIISNRRLAALGDIIKTFTQMMADRRGEISADVISSHPLSDLQTEQLKATIKAAVGRDVQVNTTVDANLLGGVIVKVGSQMIDSSLRTKLNKLKFAMKEAG